MGACIFTLLDKRPVPDDSGFPFMKYFFGGVAPESVLTSRNSLATPAPSHLGGGHD
jgi:hypothetical protein